MCRERLTERFDRRDRLDDYVLVPAIREILLIETDGVRVEVHERREDGWLRRVYLAGAALIPSVGIELPLDELYEDVDLGATGASAPESP